MANQLDLQGNAPKAPIAGSRLDLNPVGSNAKGDELAGNPATPGPVPGGPRKGAAKAQGTAKANIGQQTGANPDQDAQLLAAAILEGANGPTRNGISYNEASHGGQPTPASKKDPYESYSKAGRQTK